MNATLAELCNRILGATLNGVYQGLLLTAVLMLVFKLARGLNAATRHAVGLTALGVIALLPICHFLCPPTEKTASGQGDVLSYLVSGKNPGNSLSGGLVADPTRDREHTSDHQPNPINPVTVDANSAHQEESGQPESRIAERAEARAEHGEVKDLGSPAPGNQGWVVDSRQTKGGRRWPPNPLPSLPKAEEEGEVSHPSPDYPQFSTWQEQLLSWSSVPWSLNLAVPRLVGFSLMALWIVLALARLAALGWQHLRLNRLRRLGIQPPQDIKDFHEQLRKEWGLSRRSELLMCEEAVVPMVLGFHRPAILLPTKLVEELNEAQMEHVLRHELAHVRRRDDWANLLQQIIKGFYFFHPAVCWLSRRLTIEREIACDDHVLAVASNPRAYALFLTEFAGRVRRRHWTAAPAAWSNQSQLKERIVMILDTKRNTSPRLARTSVGILTAAAALVALLAIQAGPRLALGQEPAAAGVGLAVTASPGHAVQNNPNSNEDKKAHLATDSELDADSDVVVLPESPKPAIAPARIHQGPKPKVQPAQPPQPPIISPPAAPPVAATIAMNGPVPVMAPAFIAASRSESRGDTSLERRLERLERLVESLLERDNKNAPSSGQAPFAFNGKNWDVFSKDLMANLEKMGKAGMNEEQMARIMEEAKRAGERAAQEAKRAVEQQERAMAQLKDKFRFDQPGTQPKARIEQHRQQLESHRRNLEKQMENLERQIARLEQEQDRIDAEQQRMEEEHERAVQQQEEYEKPRPEKSKDKTIKPSKTPPSSSDSESSKEDEDKKVKKW